MATHSSLKSPKPLTSLHLIQIRAWNFGLEAVGPERICFGTDAPLYTPAPFMRLLETLAVTEEVREKIAYKNALAVLPRLAGKPGAG